MNEEMRLAHEREAGIDHALVGYDIRFGKKASLEIWDKEGRDRWWSVHFLKPDIEWPLSVYVDTWPSFFEQRGGALIKVPPINYRHECTRLWPDLNRMKNTFLESLKGQNQEGVIISIEVVPEPPNVPETAWLWMLEYDPIEPPQVPENWVFLGYDVAAEATSLLSVLTGLGHTEEEKEYWGPLLNEFGLFSRFADAWKFKDYNNLIQPDGGGDQYYVYRLCRDPEVIRSD